MEIQLIIPSPAITTNTPNFYYSAPTTPIHTTFQHDNDDDFAFDFSGQLEHPSISDADELFHCGQIKTTSRFTQPFTSSPQCKNKRNSDYFTAAFHQTPGAQTQPTKKNPPRISDILTGEDTNNKNSNSLTWYNKWNLKNLLLFRSTSEGSGRRRKDVVNKHKYWRIRKVDEDVKDSRFRSTDGCRLGRRVVSAHEIHYTENRAMTEEMRRKTYLPYKSGLLGCLGFRNNGAGSSVHEISRGFSSVMKQRGGV